MLKFLWIISTISRLVLTQSADYHSCQHHVKLGNWSSLCSCLASLLWPDSPSTFSSFTVSGFWTGDSPSIYSLFVPRYNLSVIANAVLLFFPLPGGGIFLPLSCHELLFVNNLNDPAMTRDLLPQHLLLKAYVHDIFRGTRLWGNPTIRDNFWVKFLTSNLSPTFIIMIRTLWRLLFNTFPLIW